MNLKVDDNKKLLPEFLALMFVDVTWMTDKSGEIKNFSILSHW